MEKVKVNKEVFDALESYKTRNGNRFKQFLNYDVCTNSGLLKKEEILRNLELSKLVDIAYCGYELEEKNEEKLLRLYNDCDSDVRFGISRTLEILGIKIEGINN